MNEKIENLKTEILENISGKEMWEHIEFLNNTHRRSGSKDDYKAIDYIIKKLTEYKIDNELIEFNSLISYPSRASLRLIKPADKMKEFNCKTRAFSVSSHPSGISAEVVYIPTHSPGIGITDDFNAEEITKSAYDNINVEGKIVLSKKGGPDGIKEAQDNGAIAFISTWASEEDVVHEMIATPIWGTPTLDDEKDMIKIPVVAINKEEGDYLIDLCQKEKVEVILNAEVDTKWSKLKIPVATIKGNEEPEKFVLIAGHLDSWHVGITDNATGNASCLELAKLFKNIQQNLKRSVKIAWWPGHSYGRYSGSTYFADINWIDLSKNCLAYNNIDSPGCRGAIDYTQMHGTAEVEDIIKEVIKDVTGQEPNVKRPTRCADQSFSSAGVSSLYLLMGYLPEEKRSAVGGCAGGWWWHSEYDTIDKADIDILIQDTKIYALSVLKILQSDILPYKLSKISKEIKELLQKYNEVGKDKFSLENTIELSKQFEKNCNKMENLIEKKNFKEKETIKFINDEMIKILREMIPLVYSEKGKFYQESATIKPLLPGLADIYKLNKYKNDKTKFNFCLTGLIRERNRIEYTIEYTNESVQKIIKTISEEGLKKK